MRLPLPLRAVLARKLSPSQLSTPFGSRVNFLDAMAAVRAAKLSQLGGGPHWPSHVWMHHIPRLLPTAASLMAPGVGTEALHSTVSTWGLLASSPLL